MCSTNLGFSVAYATNLGFSVGYVLCTYEYYVRMYQVSAGRNTFRPWTHTSDDSYMYQLSLVVATATVSFNFISKYKVPLREEARGVAQERNEKHPA